MNIDELMNDPARLCFIIGQQEVKIRLLQEALVNMQKKLDELDKKSVLRGDTDVE